MLEERGSAENVAVAGSALGAILPTEERVSDNAASTKAAAQQKVKEVGQPTAEEATAFKAVPSGEETLHETKECS